MTSPSKPLPPTPRSLWTDPTFICSFKWTSRVLLCVGSPSTFVRKVIGNKDLMYVIFNMVMVLVTHFLWWIMVVCIDAVRKQRRIFGPKHFFVSGARELFL